MLSWSINLFRIRGIQLAVHSSFFLLLAWRGYEGWQAEGQFGLTLAILSTLALFVCVVLHELGHSFTGMHFGVRVSRILLLPIGGMAQFDEIPKIPRQELLITIMGPAVNFVLALFFFGLRFVAPGLFDGDTLVAGLLTVLLWANVGMLCLNLLPIFPMDGGRIFRALLAYKLPYVRATFWASVLGKVLAGAGALTCCALAIFGGHQDWYITAFLFGYIFSVNNQEYKMVVRNEAQEAYWREIAARTHVPPPMPQEPPVLL